MGAVQILRARGHDVLAVQEAGRSGAADADVLADAIGHGRAVVTYNHRHFQRLHASVRSHAGIIFGTRDINYLPGLARRMHDAVTAKVDLADQFVRIVRPNPVGKPTHAGFSDRLFLILRLRR